MSQRGRLAVLFVTLVFNVLGIGLMLPVVPMLVRELTGGDIAAASAVYGWLFGTYSLMQFGFGPGMGALSDWFGRRPILLISLVGLSLDYLILALAPTIAWVFVARIVGGILAASITVTSAYIADITPEERRAQNFGLIGVAFGIGFVAGPLLGGVLGEYGSRVPFFAAAMFGVVAFTFAYFLLGESLESERRRRFRLREANPVGALIVVSRHPEVAALIAVFVLTGLAERMLEANWVLFTAYLFDWGTAEVGLSLALVGVCAALSQGGLVRVVVPAIGERRTISLGIAVAAVSMVALAFVTRPWMVFAIIVPYVLGWGMVGPAVQALVTRAVPASEQGILQGALTSMMMATGILGPPVAGGLFAFFIGESAPVHLPGAAMLAGAALFVAGFTMALRYSSRVHAAGGGV